MPKSEASAVKVLKANQSAIPAFTPIYAAVDIGSGGIKVSFYGFDPKGEIVEVDVVEQVKFRCDMASIVSAEGIIIEAILKDAKQALKDIAKLLKKYKIASDNMGAIATEWARAIEGTPAGDRVIRELRAAFEPCSFEIISPEQEAQLVYEAACQDPQYKSWVAAVELYAPKENLPYMAILSPGGASAEACIISPAKGAVKLTTISHGVSSLKKLQADMGTVRAGNAFVKALHDEGAFQYEGIKPQGFSALFAMGRGFRTVGRVVCAPKETQLLDARHAFET